MTAKREVLLRLPADDAEWFERLATKNDVALAAFIRAVLHAVRIMAEEGALASLNMGELVLRG